MSSVWNKLGQSNVGKELVEKLREKQLEACDCRNWEDGENKESALHASRLIEDIITKIQKNSPTASKKDEAKSEYD